MTESQSLDAARTALVVMDYQPGVLASLGDKVFYPHVPGRLLHHEHPDASVHSQLAPQPQDIVVRKTRLGAFSTSDFDDQLRACGVRNLLLCGIHTKGVLLATVVEAVDRDYPVYVIADASADPDLELHAMLVDRVFSFQSHVVTTEQLSALLGRQP